MITAIYAGTFDPITNGHLDIIRRSLSFSDNLIVAIGVNPNKKTLFTTEQRITQIIESVKSIVPPRNTNTIKVISFQGLLVDEVKKQNANLLIRGIRSVSDFEYELTLSGVNKVLAPNVETVFLPTSPELAVVSSSMVKEIAKHGGDISSFVSPTVSNDLRSIFAKD